MTKIETIKWLRGQISTSIADAKEMVEQTASEEKLVFAKPKSEVALWFGSGFGSQGGSWSA